MPLSLQEIVAGYEAGATSHQNGKTLADGARSLWDAAYAAADGYRPAEWLPIAPLEWLGFALLSAGTHGPGRHDEDEELAVQVRRLLDLMVREAQHQGLAFDEDEDEEPSLPPQAGAPPARRR
jgi:hypothetical protein